ncbi:hypothetical protein [Epibacterium ulvae]|uniref:hypothetical protein n=1 Tax=Epibacterium ulvae TaxID=1156985 RepID=UPI00249133E6|nr:hypothetical protein [Epibacterium ulvae]
MQPTKEDFRCNNKTQPRAAPDVSGKFCNAAFPAKLKVIHPRWTEEEADWPLTPIINEYDLVISSLARLYEVRHVLTHELPSSPFLDPVEVPTLAAAAKSFITATDWRGGRENSDQWLRWIV